MSLDHLSVLSPAKINLFLHVHQQRADGYHELKTYFQLVDLYDQLTFTVNHGGDIQVNNPAIAIAQEQDLCYRAAQLLRPYADESFGVSIDVDKKIPDGGGLGGGSSNAATVLCTLNNLWNINLAQEKLLALALQLGSDVPIFVHGQSSYAEGRGEVFSHHLPNDLYKGQTIVIIKPDIHVSTPHIFHSPLLAKRPAAKKITAIDTVLFDNDFEKVVFHLYPHIANICETVSRISPAHLTGTGACLYSLVDSTAQAQRIQDAVPDCQVFTVQGLSTV